MKLVGIKWGKLEKATQEWLLKDCDCVNAVTVNDAYNGDCIVDLTENLSVAGKIVDGDIAIDDDAKIILPSIVSSFLINHFFQIHQL